jgi:hypothetical protein
MSTPLLLLVASIYGYVALEQLIKGQAAGFVVWLSYACANVALIWYVK